jgi:uncharacterized protein (TIGR02597 family)
MKPIQIFILAAASSGIALGAETAYSPAVGYVTYDVPALADTTISPALEKPALLQTASAATGGISGNTITFAAQTPAVATGAFVSPPCYVQVTSGPLVGQRFPVNANSETTVEVESPVSSLQSLGFASGNTFKVVPYWTLNTLFPEGAGVGSTDDVSNIISLLYVVDNGSYGTNRAASGQYFYCSGDVAMEVPAGWHDAGNPFGPVLDDLIIDPTVMYFIRNGSETANTVTVSGKVPDVNSVALVPVTTEQNDAFLGTPIPVDMSLQESGLLSVVQGTASVANIEEIVYVFDDADPSQNKAPAFQYFYCTGDTEMEVPAGWHDAANPFGPVVTDKVLKAGRCIYIRKAAYAENGVLSWTIPLPY